jgi:hypothetical protein
LIWSSTVPEYKAVRNDRGDEYPVVASAFNSEIHTEIEGATVARDGFGRLVVAPSEPTAPKRSDNKSAWVTHAVNQGADPAEAEAMTKADLIAHYGS